MDETKMQPAVPDGEIRPQGRDDLEGRYTETDPEVPETRTVHGQYTHASGVGGPDPRIEGEYVGLERQGGTPPSVHESVLRHGNYPKAEH